MDTEETIILGVVSGIITSAIFFTIKSVCVNTLWPLYRQAIYKGISLKGKWYSVNENQKTIFEIEQVCEKITGKATVLLTNREKVFHIDDIRTFDISGKVTERFVVISMEHTDKTRIGISMFLLQVIGDGTKLSGETCWYNPIGSFINSGDVNYYRDEKRAEEEIKD